MATKTENDYVGNGSTKLYSFTFPYIEIGDVYVSIDGVDQALTTEYSFANATTISFVTAPPSGSAIRIYRRTKSDDLSNVFYPGSAIRAQDLNDNFVQNLYVTQESVNEAADASAAAEVAQAAAQQAAIDAQQAADDATQAAQDAAQAAQDSASASVDATNALIAANAAQDAANLAKLDAAAAKADASTAVNSATSAESNASLAQAAATSAQESATKALIASQDALASAEAALILIENFIGSGVAYDILYQVAAGSAGSKSIDLGDLSSISTCSNTHFPGEDVVTSQTYNMGLGCSSIDYGSV
jgi:hypothetical protein